MSTCVYVRVRARACVRERQREREKERERGFIYVYTYQQDGGQTSETIAHMWIANEAGDNPNDVQNESIGVHKASASNLKRCTMLDT